MIDRQDWSAAGGIRLERNALLAVAAKSQHVLIEAGPGSGKTEVLAQRADFLFRTGDCPYPSRILAVSFKVDAARNLRNRVRTRSGERYASRFDSLTFHAFAKRLIDNYRPSLTGAYALESDFQIHPTRGIQGRQVTFAQLVPHALEVLRSNSFALGALRHTYSHVLLDEFQDATRDQYALVTEAFLDSDTWVTAVGDTKQRIMAWAGALDGIMGTYSRDFDATEYRLHENFRSAPALRRLQAGVVSVLEPSAEAPVPVPNETPAQDGSVSVMRFETADEEAETVAQMIEAWVLAGTEPSDCAVLVRQQPALLAAGLMANLRARGLLVTDESQNQDLFSEPAAKLVFNFVRVVSADRQHRAYSELMSASSRTAGSEDADARAASRLQAKLWEARKRVHERNAAGFSPTWWSELIFEFLELFSDSSLRALSRSYRTGNRLSEVVAQAIQHVTDAFASEPDVNRASRSLAGMDSVRVLTIHKSKGLEFDKVVVMAVENETFWGDDSLQEFFVAISRAKSVLVLTHADLREPPEDAPFNWRRDRSPKLELLSFVCELPEAHEGPHREH